MKNAISCLSFALAVCKDSRVFAQEMNATGDAGLPPMSLIKSTDAMQSLVPPKFVDPNIRQKRAIPTNAWWANLIAYDKSNVVQPAWSNPFSISIIIDRAPFGIALNYPYARRFTGGSSGNNGAVKFYSHGLVKDAIFGAIEFSGQPKFLVTDWSDLGCTLELSTSSDCKIVSDILSGMAYGTYRYTNLTPKLTMSTAIISLNGEGPGTVTTSRLEISLNNGQKWIVYSLSSEGTVEEPITWTCEDGTNVRASSVFNGIIRASLLVGENGNPEVSAALDRYRTCIPISGTVDIPDDTSYSLEYKTMGDCGGGLLHYGQQHHVDSIDMSFITAVTGMTSNSATRGPMQALATNCREDSCQWKFFETQETATDIFPPRGVSTSLTNQHRLMEKLRQDIEAQWSVPLGGSYYFNGKLVQKYASLCIVASDENVVGSDSALLQTCLGKLREVMQPYLTNSWTNELVYDVIYGGIVSSEGFKRKDAGADFGNSMYNDHHFHFGYWLYTSAIIIQLDPKWERIDELKTMSNLLAYDVANCVANDANYPRFRNFDWFRGHSYSHGATSLGDGKDQESSSEDINFSFGLYLYGKASANPLFERIGRVMTRLNTRAVKMYFLMQDGNTIHPSNFIANKVTGIIFDNKADYATWFSPEKYSIHGIQMLPVSPQTELVRTKAFVQQEWEQVLSREPIVRNENIDNTWLSLLYLNYAQLDPNRAMEVLERAAMDDGLTRTWALYMSASYAV